MIEKMIQEDFLNTPIKKYKGDVAPDLSESELAELINRIKSYIELDSLSELELEQSNTFYWLTYGLSHAMKNKNFSISYEIASIFYKISKQYPHLAITMLGKTIDFGEFKGQTGIFVWMDRLYSATFNSIFSPTLVAFNTIFSHLLEQEGNAFSSIMVKPIESGFTSGTNALLNLIYALKNASEYDCNQSITHLIAELLAKFINQSPNEIGFVLTQEITKGTFSGTRYMDFIIPTLARCSQDNIDAVDAICKILLIVNEKHPQPLMDSLTKIAQSGYNQGMHAFHIIFTALVSASYIENNTKMFNLLVDLIHKFFKKSPDSISSALTQPIKTGIRTGENGVMHLVQALTIAMDRNIDTSTITNLLLKIIEHNGNDLAEAFNSKAVSKNTFYLVTALSKLESKLNKEQTTDIQKTELEGIVKKLLEINSHHRTNI
ncbi:hypothetical protein A6J40_08140 [Legionella longbeachae]|uniref:Uncharacterized protein n=2 Tax=Legionella longbeachae TaxID=450 RepID=D3HQ12_LEGLN|nr:hypothetical protein A6J40_08140 [Legionella longbeachae]EEZ96022.1 hypothetical protein LLB_1205 [Legionella longbeachae D-4968]CBJ10977.1 hypothetical protein LLO_0640 [Legionella longbeachae NSW150]VEE01496.1 Uncharacterised protein [Legionella oakridgensis]HBD7396214.1 hypothetical protein [Legionella pneumophila]